MRSFARSNLVIRVPGLLLLAAAITFGVDDITDIDPASDSTAIKIVDAGMGKLKVTAKGHNGYTPYTTNLIDSSTMVTAGTGMFGSVDGELRAFIGIGATSTYTGMTVEVIAYKPGGSPEDVSKSSTNVTINNP
jgi:hypothetical protein